MDVERLLQPVSDADPSGPDLSYDPARIELETLAKGTAEQHMGDVQVAAEEPNWREVFAKADELFQKSKDVRVLLWITVASIREQGLPGFANAIKLARGLNERFWDTYFPRLDAEDNNDPTERMNALACMGAPADTFGDPYKVIRRLREATFVSHPQLGRFTFRDVQIARGDIPPPPHAEGVPPPPELPAIEGAFSQLPEDDLNALLQSLTNAKDDLAALNALLAEKVGFDRSAQLDPLTKAVAEMVNFVQEQLARRTGGATAGSRESPRASAAGASSFSTGGIARSGGGTIASSSDVVLALEDLIRYYEHHEVSSPVPLVLKAAQRLVGKRFLDITRILTPEAIRLVEQMTSDTQEPPAP